MVSPLCTYLQMLTVSWFSFFFSFAVKLSWFKQLPSMFTNTGEKKERLMQEAFPFEQFRASSALACRLLPAWSFK